LGTVVVELFTGRMLYLSPNQQHQSTEECFVERLMVY